MQLQSSPAEICSPMKYLVRKQVLAPVPEYAISREEFHKAQRSQSTLRNALSIEEKYEILLSNFIEFEQTALTQVLSNAVRDLDTYDEFFENRVALNARLVNFLSAARLYLDQLPQHMIGETADESHARKERLKAKCADQYDAHFEYRFMEALRNYVQHRGIPIHLTTYQSRWQDGPDHRYMEFSIRLVATREKLREDGRFKANILAEMPLEVEIPHALRQYVEAISEIHCFARGTIQAEVVGARDYVESLHARYAQLYDKSLATLSAIELDDDQRLIKSVPLGLEWDDVRIGLQKRNRKLANLTKRSVVSMTQAT